MAGISGAHHVALTVTDVERSARFYQDLLGLQEAMRGGDDDVRFVVMVDPSSGWAMGVREYPKVDDGPFDEHRTGLDHLAFGVSSREELAAWEAELERRGIPYTPAAETPIGTVVVFRDPDNIQLEFWLPVG